MAAAEQEMMRDGMKRELSASALRKSAILRLLSP
jgi:hypothetical protein